MLYKKPRKQRESGLLRLLDHFQKPLNRLNVNYTQLRLILKYKLLLDLRDTSFFSYFANNRSNRKQPQNVFASLWYYIIYGAIMALTLLIGNPFTGFGYFFLTYFVILFTSILSGFSSVLLDPRDRPIIGVRGVSDRTLNVARLIHVSYYIGTIACLLVSPAVLLLIFKVSPITALLFLIMAVLFTLFTSFTALLLYFGILHIFNGDKLKNIINIFQIGFMIFIYVAGQLPSLFENLHVSFQLSSVWHWWNIFAFPLWFAAPLAAFQTAWTPSLWIFTGFAVAGLVLSIFYYFHISGQFEINLQKMAQHSDHAPRTSLWQRTVQTVYKRQPQKLNYLRLSWRLNQTERDYHLRVYPTLGLSFFIVIVFIMNFGLNNGSWQAIMGNRWVSLVAYALTFCIPQLIINLRYSTTPDAMNVFRLIPHFKASDFRKATVIMIFTRLLLPQALLIGVLIIPLIGWQAAVTLANATLYAFVMMTIVARVNLAKLPFSAVYTANQASGIGIANSFVALLGCIPGILINGLGLIPTAGWGNLIVTVVFVMLVLIVTHHRETPVMAM